MCDAFAVGLVAELVNTGIERNKRVQENLAQADYYIYLGRQFQTRSRLFREQGGMEAGQLGTKVRNLTETQKSAFAANQIDLSSGSVADVTKDTLTQGRLDELAILYNANIKAWEADTQAEEHFTAAENARRAAFETFTSGTMVSSAIPFSPTFDSWRSRPKSKKVGGMGVL